MSDPEVETGRIAERLKALVDKSNDIQKTAQKALDASNAATSDIRNATTRLDGEIKLLKAAIAAQKDNVRAEIWKDLYGSVWKPIAIVATIVGLLSVGAHSLTAYLLSRADTPPSTVQTTAQTP